MRVGSVTNGDSGREKQYTEGFVVTAEWIHRKFALIGEWIDSSDYDELLATREPRKINAMYPITIKTITNETSPSKVKSFERLAGG